MERPKSLHDLWEEYQFGMGDNKPAKAFTTVERNNTINGLKKQKYYQRSKVWKVQVYLVNGGKSIHSANATMQRVFQCDKPTKIIDYLIRDGKNTAFPMVPAVGFRLNPMLLPDAI